MPNTVRRALARKLILFQVDLIIRWRLDHWHALGSAGTRLYLARRYLPTSELPKDASYANGRFSVAVAYFHVQHTHRPIQIQASFFMDQWIYSKILGERMEIGGCFVCSLNGQEHS